MPKIINTKHAPHVREEIIEFIEKQNFRHAKLVRDKRFFYKNLNLVADWGVTFPTPRGMEPAEYASIYFNHERCDIEIKDKRYKDSLIKLANELESIFNIAVVIYI